jgi:hypothetical protein
MSSQYGITANDLKQHNVKRYASRAYVLPRVNGDMRFDAPVATTTKLETVVVEPLRVDWRRHAGCYEQVRRVEV